MSAWHRARLVLGGLTTDHLLAGEEDAPLLVLLHDGAWGASAEASWGRLIPVLAERYRVVAPDLYGYGGSSKVVQLDAAPYELRLRQVGALLDALGYGSRTAHVVGSSFGGAMALRSAITPWFSWRLRSVTSISGTGGPYRTADGQRALARFDGTRQDMRRIVRLLAGDFDGIEEQVDLRLRHARNAGHHRSIAAVAVEVPFPTERTADPYPAALRGARMPLAVLAGSDDALVEPQWAASIAAHAPLGRVVAFSGRHSPNLADPEGTVRMLLEVLTEHERVEWANV